MQMRFRQRAALEVAADVHLEAEPAAGIDELGREEGLVGVAAHQSVLVPETPSPVVPLMSVGGDAALDELAVGRLDVAKEAVRTAEHRAGLDVARRREQSPHTPLQTIVEWGRV